MNSKTIVALLLALNSILVGMERQKASSFEIIKLEHIKINVGCSRSNGWSALDALLFYACAQSKTERILWLILILKHTSNNQLNTFFKENEKYWIAKYFNLIRDISAKIEEEHKAKFEFYNPCPICLKYIINNIKQNVDTYFT